jgi:acetyl esterase/lipase
MDLTDAYENGAYIPGAADFPPRWAAEAEALRAELGARAELDIPYGSEPREVFDLFHPDGDARGTVVFVHGGYWKAFDKSTWSGLARGPLARGWRVAMPSYDLCPDVRISTITRQIAQAVATIARKAEGPLVLTGHSAGGHLVARMGAPDLLPDRVRDRVAAIVPISPLSDLAPLIETGMNAVLRIDAAEAAEESPVRQPRPEADVTVWVGGAERPAFLDQARWLAEAWDARCHVDTGRHHFDVIDALADPESPLTKSLTGD